jgi:hypothetical protein
MPPAPDDKSARKAFAYPETEHHRRHGPQGYVDDEHFKPWVTMTNDDKRIEGCC